MRISDWSSDVCSSDLAARRRGGDHVAVPVDHVDVAGVAVDLRHGGLARAGGVARPGRPDLDPRVEALAGARRSAERRVGKERVSTCRSRRSPYHSKKKHTTNNHTTLNTKQQQT